MSAEERLTVSVSRRDVEDLLGTLAELSIAVNETKVIEQNIDRQKRLERAQALANRWSVVFRLKDDYDAARESVS